MSHCGLGGRRRLKLDAVREYSLYFIRKMHLNCVLGSYVNLMGCSGGVFTFEAAANCCQRKSKDDSDAVLLSEYFELAGTKSKDRILIPGNCCIVYYTFNIEPYSLSSESKLKHAVLCLKQFYTTKQSL